MNHSRRMLALLILLWAKVSRGYVVSCPCSNSPWQKRLHSGRIRTRRDATGPSGSGGDTSSTADTSVSVIDAVADSSVVDPAVIDYIASSQSYADASAGNGHAHDTPTAAERVVLPPLMSNSTYDGSSSAPDRPKGVTLSDIVGTTMSDTDDTTRISISELVSRRVWMARIAGAAAVGGSAMGGTVLYREWQNETALPQPKKLAPVNLTQVARETTINVTMECTRTCVTLDSRTFQKKQSLKVPSWFPNALVPPPRVIKDIPNTELLIAAIVAGSVVEMVRTALLYPLQTLKTRIQTDSNKRNTNKLKIRRRVKILRLNAIRHFREGQLYAGLLPSLLVSVPATGVYYGARDTTRRMLVNSGMGDVVLTLTCAFVADVVSLVFRTPADTLAVRLQVATADEAREHDEDALAEAIADALAEARLEGKVGDWFMEGLQRLPAVILTDLPYLLSRIAVNSLLIQGQTIDIGHYELTTFVSAIVCGFLTTPFDVARTRILVDSDDDPINGIDGGSGHGLIQTMRMITEEGNGGVRNLFSGWLERTTYLGISSLWLPFALILYMAIRDAILLEWFD